MENVLTAHLGDDLLNKLADALLANDPIVSGKEQTPLHEKVIALPTKRACIHFTDLLLQKRDALLLPAVVPLGDSDALDDIILEGVEEHLIASPNAITPIERHLILTALIQKAGLPQKTRHLHSSPSHQSGLALALAQFLDITDRAEINRAELKNLVPDNLAEHWQIVLDYLNILVDAWPNYLKETKQNDVVVARNHILRRFADNLHNLNRPFIIAGSTGSQTATAYLIEKTIQYKKGIVILPPLDLDLEEDTWKALPPSHPQFGLKSLLDKVSLTRAQVRTWDKTAQSPKTLFMRAAFHPANVPHAPIDKKALAAATQNIELIEANNHREEASAIAMMMLKNLKENDGLKIALITPDRTLAHYVRVILKRFGAEIDDEAGQPLTQEPSFIFLKLIAEMLVENFSFLPLLSCLKHPLALAGLGEGVLRNKARHLEYDLRSNTCTLQDNHIGLDAYPKEHQGLVDIIKKALAPLLALRDKRNITCSVLLEAHIQCAENLAASDSQSGAELLWQHNQSTQRLAEHIGVLLEEKELLDGLGSIPLNDYPNLFESFFATAPAVRPNRALGAQLHIWQPAEARLQRADLIVLGGLNTGVWPQHLTADPWLSRAMRKKLGLEEPETQIGLSAHDFTEGLSHSKVLLTRSKKDAGGNPLEPSPWLLRIKNLLESAQMKLSAPENFTQYLSNFYHKPMQLIDSTLPTPPLSAKPTEISATAFTKLLNNPYAFYAEYILRLKELPPFSIDPQAVERGSLIHDILQAFVEKYPNTLPKDAEQKLIALGENYFDNNSHPIVRLFWKEKFIAMAKEFIYLEKNILRATSHKIFTEIQGKYTLPINDVPITLRARADRIDANSKNAIIYDYKTGAKPVKNIEKAPQLQFEAFILQNGGFEALASASSACPSTCEVAYINLKEKTAAKMIDKREFHITEIQTLITTQLSRYLSDTMEWEANENAPYKTYHHLARIKEKQ